MAFDPADPRCPECDGKVSATAPYCMHCGADFETPASPADDRTGRGGRADRGGRAEGLDREPATSTGSSPQEAGGGRSEGWLAPDGWLDDSLTAVVGVGAGLVVGVLALVLLSTTLPDAVAGPGVLLAWLGSTVYLARRRTVFGALRAGCYAVAALLVALPFVTFTGATVGGDVAGHVVLFVLGELVLGTVALVVAGVGYAAGRRRPAES